MLKRVTLSVLTICMLTISMVVVALAGTTYYVSPTGNDSNDGSMNAPFKTIQKAADVVNPGDTVIVKNGVYTRNDWNIVKIRRGGTSTNYITFKSENKWGAILDGLNTNDGVSIEAPFIVFEGFEARNMYLTGIGVTDGTNNVIIRNNYIHNIGNWHVTTNYPYCTVYAVVEYPDCYSWAANGIVPGGDNITIENNVIHTVGKTGWSGRYEPGRYDHAIYGTYVNNLKIINNIIWDVWTGKAIDLAASNSIVANNTILRLTEPPSGQPNDSGLMAITGGSNQIIQNNIFYGCNGQPPIVKFTDSSYTSINNNLTSSDCPPLSSIGNKTGVSFSANIENKDPLFVNLIGRDFHLQSSSPAIDKGKSFSERTKDADGNLISGLPDIGAYEYTGNTVTPTGDTTPPSAPSNLSGTANSPVNLSWTASTDNVGVVGYKIYRNNIQIATTSNTSYTDTNTQPSTTYTYAVSSYDAAGNESAKSNSITVTTPSNYSINNITVRAKGEYGGGEWPAMEVWINGSKINAVTVNSISYQDYSFSFNSGNVNTIDVVFINDYYDSNTGEDRNLWIDYIIVNNQKYEAESPSTIYDRGYASAAFDAVDVIPGQELMLWYGALRFKLSAIQSYDSAGPTAPSNLKAGAITSSTIVLSWSPSTDNVGVAGYKIFRNGSQIAATTATTYKDRKLSSSTTFTYTVIAYNVNGDNSQPSNTLSVKTLESRK